MSVRSVKVERCREEIYILVYINLAGIKFVGLPRVSMSKTIGGLKFGGSVQYVSLQCSPQPKFKMYGKAYVCYFMQLQSSLYKLHSP